MRFVADLHIHSRYSIATSKRLIPEYLDYWARIKGIRVLGSGDFTHPGWIVDLEEALRPAEDGFFILDLERKRSFHSTLTAKTERPVFILPRAADTRFVLSAEISTIYKKHGKVRKVHSVVLVRRFEDARRIAARLAAIGNITSDGRPILGMDAKDLLAICLDVAPDVVFIPAHVWTPWFSVLGDKSGFSSVEECFEDLPGEIPAVETGLSSDPPMNWIGTGTEAGTESGTGTRIGMGTGEIGFLADLPSSEID